MLLVDGFLSNSAKSKEHHSNAFGALTYLLLHCCINFNTIVVAPANGGAPAVIETSHAAFIMANICEFQWNVDLKS